MKKTFAELGIPFPLYQGDIETTNEYVGRAVCSICKRADQHCFALEIGCYIMIDCPGCGKLNGLDADDRCSEECHACETEIEFPDINDDEEVRTCYDCLRQGKAAITKGTELGMISWQQALAGKTNGRPGLAHPDFELTPAEDGWVMATLPTEIMFELIRTPNYSTWQGECWLFCCKNPMVYIGSWEREQFSQHAPDGNGKAFFEQIVQDIEPGLWEDRLHDLTGIYVFQCANCNRITANWDIA